MRNNLIEILLIILLLVLWDVPMPNDISGYVGLLLGAIALAVIVSLERSDERKNITREGMSDEKDNEKWKIDN